MAEQGKLIRAAAEAGIKWILPNEYSCDGMNDKLIDAVPMFQPKREATRMIEDIAKMHPGLKYIGVTTNPWTEFVSSNLLLSNLPQLKGHCRVSQWACSTSTLKTRQRLS